MEDPKNASEEARNGIRPLNQLESRPRVWTPSPPALQRVEGTPSWSPLPHPASPPPPPPPPHQQGAPEGGSALDWTKSFTDRKFSPTGLLKAPATPPRAPAPGCLAPWTGRSRRGAPAKPGASRGGRGGDPAAAARSRAPREPRRPHSHSAAWAAARTPGIAAGLASEMP